MIKYCYKLLVLTILTISSLNAGAQQEEEAVKVVINQLFEGMKKTDTAMIRAAFSSDALLQTVGKTREGKTIVRSDALDSFIVSIARPRKEVLDERIRFETVKIDGDLAFAWTPYQFFIGDQFSHCGVNSFQLVRLNGQWKIQYLIDTRRRQNCN